MNVSFSLDYLADKFKINLLAPFGLEIKARKQRSFPTLIEGSLLKQLIKVFRVVVLREFDLVDKSALVRYAQTIGPLLEWEFGHVMEMRAHEEPKNYLFTHGHVPFHWDGAFHQEPRYLLFHCIAAPRADSGGETIFSNTNQIWRDASEKEKTTWMRHKLTYKTEKLAHYGGSITVPLVQDHLDTKEKILRFAEPVPTSMLNPVEVYVEEMMRDDSDAFIAAMAQRCYQKDKCYIHAWQENDFLIADNYALIHARRAFEQFSPRHLRRIQVL